MTISVDSESLGGVANAIRMQATALAGERTTVPWPGGEECGSSVVAAALQDINDWYQMTWSSFERGVDAVGQDLFEAAAQYSATDAAVAESFRFADAYVV